jgi:hypothetical protein
MAFSLMFMVIFCGRGGALEYNARGRRDPFVPLAGVTRKGTTGGIYSVDDVMLQGIVIGPDGAYNAIINGKVVKAGDTVGRLFVESIENNVVVIKIGELTHKVKLYDK